MTAQPPTQTCGCFIAYCEAKDAGPDGERGQIIPCPLHRDAKATARGWDVLMRAAEKVLEKETSLLSPFDWCSYCHSWRMRGGCQCVIGTLRKAVTNAVRLKHAAAKGGAG